MRQDDFRKYVVSVTISVMDEHKLSYFLLKAILNTILRIENIGQIYHKHTIHKMLHCDLTKALEQDF